MSTTQQQLTDVLAALERVRQTFETKETDIDARVAAAFAQADQAFSNFISASRGVQHVHAVDGDDGADGTAGAPIKTIDEALRRIPAGGQLAVNLLSDYLIDSMIPLEGDNLFINGDGTQTLRFAEVDPNNPDSVRSPGFFPANGGAQTFIRFQNVTISAGQNPTPAVATIPAMIHVGSPTFVRLLGCEILLPPGSDQALCSLGDFLFLNSDNTVVPADMPGRWVHGLPAGTAASDRPLLQSNLTTL